MSNPKKSLRRTNTDGITVTQDEAVELCIHHLRLAALFYECTPNDKNRQIDAEAIRIMTDPEIPHYFGPDLQAALVWLKTMFELHEKMKKQD